MRIVYMGSAEISETCLRVLAACEGMTLCGVVTQPDRPSGRGRGLKATPVKRWAQGAGLPVLEPEKINSDDVIEAIGALAADVVAVVAYGQILGRRLLALPRLGCVNLHTSLLPAYRGAAPIQWAIVNGETQTGVTTMQMVPEMDAGDILLQQPVAIAPEDTAGTLHDKLALVGAPLLVETLKALRDGRVLPRPQEARLATFAPKLTRESGEIDWTLPARQIYNRVRGFNPWPACRTCVRQAGAREAAGALGMKVLRVRVEAGAGEPGRVLDVGGEGPLVAAGAEALRVLEVQPEGRSVMSGRAFVCGYAPRVGDRWGGGSEGI